MRGARFPCANLLVLALLSLAFAGCVDSDAPGAEAEGASLSALETYEFRFAGDDVFSGAGPHGWLVQVTNVDDAVVEFRYTVQYPNTTAVTHGPATDDGWMSEVTPDAPPKRVRLNPGSSVAYLFQATLPDGTTNITYTLEVLDADQHVVESKTFVRDVKPAVELRAVSAGHHVQTATVGVYSNGTSFYTNIADLYRDEAFPFWVPPEEEGEFDDTPLPVYVYDESADEQPNASRDTCYFVTISGYNELLKTQLTGSTNVRWLAPEEAYTAPGREDSFLYGEDLIFLNTIVAHDGGTSNQDQAPDPTGECFDPERYAGMLPVPSAADLALPLSP